MQTCVRAACGIPPALAGCQRACFPPAAACCARRITCARAPSASLDGCATYTHARLPDHPRNQGIVFVVDAANSAQFGEAKSTLWGIMDKAPKVRSVYLGGEADSL
jgi:hypothetical protein